MTRSERGSITVLVVIMTIALGAVAGLVVDGGTVLAARRRAFDEAEAAARAGAQAIDLQALRASGIVRLDPELALRRVAKVVSAGGRTATVEVSDDRVSVSLSFQEPLRLLSVLGLRPVRIAGEGSARATSTSVMPGGAA